MTTAVAAPLALCDREFEAGTRTATWLPITQVWNGPFNIPLIVAHGAQPGPRLLLIGMHHGDEYDGFTTAHRLMSELQPAQMRGSVVCVPCLNVPAFLSGGRQSLFDGLDMNRVHPGKERGFFAEQIVHFLDTRLLPGSDCVIDLHGGNLNLQVLPYVGFGAWDDRSRALAKATGIPNLYPIDEDRLHNTLLVATRERGIPHLNIEAGGGLWGRPETIETMVRGIRNVLIVLGVIDGQPQGLPGSYFLRRSNMISSTTGGFFRADVHLGASVNAGDRLGVIVNLLGEVIEEIRAPAAAFVQDLKTIPRVWPGEWLVLLGESEQELPA